MEEILIGQVVELDEDNKVCILFSDRPSIVVSKKVIGKVTIGSFIICKIKEEKSGKTSIQKLFTFHDTQVGEIVFDENEPFIEISYKKDQTIKIPCKYHKDFYDGLKIRFRLENTSSGIMGIVYQILGDKIDLGIDIMDLAERHSIPTIFCKKALKQAAFIREPVLENDKEDRRDLSRDQIFTIDGIHSKDFDDAISLSEEDGKMILRTHIADVDYFVPEGSPLDLEARKRGMTAYLLNYVSPMFPESISNGVCSLKEGIDRFTLTTRMQISKTGIIEKVDCYPSMINSKKRMTYEDANQVLSGKRVAGYQPFVDTLHEMYDLASLLYQRRMDRGAIEFDSSEPVFEMDQYGKVIDVEARNRGKSEFIIQEFMLATNESIPLILDNLGIMYPHRIHLEPSIGKLKEVYPKLQSLGVDISPLLDENLIDKSKVLNYILRCHKNNPNYPVISSLLVSCMRRATYGIEDLGHFGLALPRNVHFTSPIRRYPDLVNHRLIRKHYFHKLPQIEAEIEDLNNLSIDCSSYESRINKCEEQVIRLKIKEYLLSNVGNEMDAIIKDCSEKGILLEIKNCIEEWISEESLEGSIFDKEKYCFRFYNSQVIYGLGTKVKVKIEKNPFDYNQVVLKIVEPNNVKLYSLKSKNNFL